MAVPEPVIQGVTERVILLERVRDVVTERVIGAVVGTAVPDPVIQVVTERVIVRDCVTDVVIERVIGAVVGTAVLDTHVVGEMVYDVQVVEDRVIVCVTLGVRDLENVGVTVIVSVNGRVVITGVIDCVSEEVGQKLPEGDCVLVAKFVVGIGEGVVVIVELWQAE